MIKALIVTYSIYALYLIDITFESRFFPRTISIEVYIRLFGLVVLYYIGVTLYYILFKKSRLERKFVVIAVNLVTLLIGMSIIMAYAIVTPVTIGFCEGNLVYYESAFGECSQNLPVYTRTSEFGSKTQIEQLSVSCRGDVRVIDQKYIDSQCIIFDR